MSRRSFRRQVPRLPRRRRVEPTLDYQRTAEAALLEASAQLGIRIPVSIRYWHSGFDFYVAGETAAYYDGSRPDQIHVVTDLVPIAQLLRVVRHELYHLAYHAHHGADDDEADHDGPSERGAQAFEAGVRLDQW